MSKTPFQTGIAVANSMVGTSLLIVPVNFLKTGIIQNFVATVTQLIIKVIMSIIMGSTAVAIGSFVSGRYK